MQTCRHFPAIGELLVSEKSGVILVNSSPTCNCFTIYYLFCFFSTPFRKISWPISEHESRYRYLIVIICCFFCAPLVRPPVFGDVRPRRRPSRRRLHQEARRRAGDRRRRQLRARQATRDRGAVRTRPVPAAVVHDRLDRGI